MVEATGRLFAKFATWYGKHWLDMWAGIDMAAVKQEWANELQHFGAPTLKWALEQCKHRKFPPTLPEFLCLCRDVPRHVIDAAKEQQQKALPAKACFLGEEEARKRLAEICREVGLRTRGNKAISRASVGRTE